MSPRRGALLAALALLAPVDAAARTRSAPSTKARTRRARPAPAAASDGSAPAPVNPPDSSPLPFQFMALVEGDYRAFSTEAEGYAGFALRRARMGVRARPLAWLELTFVGEYARSVVGILDAFATLRPAPTFEINAGFLRLPTLPSGRDDRVFALAIPERSMTVTALWPNRDLGVEAHWFPRAPFELWARVGNGSGNPLGPEGNTPTGALRADLVLGRASAHASREAPVGARIGAAILVGATTVDRAGIAGTTPLGFVFARAVPIDGLRVTATGHARVWAGPVRVSIEGGFSRDARSRDADGDPRTPRVELDPVHTAGAALEAAWMLTGHRRHGDDWPYYPHANWLPSWAGALELAARAERLSLGFGARDVLASGVWGGALALRWWANRWSALSIAGYVNNYDRPPLEAPDVTTSWSLLVRGTVRVP